MLSVELPSVMYVSALNLRGQADVSQIILHAVGIGGGVAAAGIVETGDIIVIWKQFAESLGMG